MQILEKSLKPQKFRYCDVTSEEEVKNLVEFAVNDFGSIHGLVNCAGIAIGEKTLGRNGPHRLDSFAKVININLIGSFNLQ